MHRELQLLAPPVYIYPRDETPNTVQPNIGVIALDDETILIDGGNSPRHARNIIAAINEQHLAPVSTIIVTHHHWDHTFGLAYFGASQIIASEACAARLAEDARREWSVAALEADTAANPRREASNNAIIDAISDWRDFRIAEPTITFNSRLTFYRGDIPIEIEYVGGRHAPDSAVVRLPQQRVMFLGDSYYPLPPSEREPGDEDLDLTMLATFAQHEYDFYVDGHGAPRTHAELQKMISWERGRQEANRE